MSAQSKGTASSSSSPSEGPPAASKAKVKEQIKIIVEDLELVLGDLKDVAKELKEVRMKGCAGGTPVCPVWGKRPTAPRPGPELPPELRCCPRALFAASSPRVEQLVSRLGTGQLSAVPGAGHRCAARRPGAGWSPASRSRVPRDSPCHPPLRAGSLGDFPPQGSPRSFIFSRGEPLLRGPYWARKVFWEAAGPAALPNSGLNRAGGGRGVGSSEFNFGVGGAAPCWPQQQQQQPGGER